MRRRTLLPGALLLSGCASVDTRILSENQDSRVLFLILHYTVADFEESLRTLTRPSANPVSAHYLVDQDPPRVYRLVDEERRAWHAGNSFWKGHAQLNASSIGIEMVNTGGRPLPGGGWDFKPFPPAQIEAVIALVRDIVRRHRIRPEFILGHGEIQPQGKQDPGPLFPWPQLARAGLIPWPDADLVGSLRPQHEQNLPGLEWFRARLVQHGFQPGTDERLLRDQLAAFQMRYRPSRYDGKPDAETAALLDAITRPGGLKFAR